MWLHIYILKSHENVYERVGGVGLVAKSFQLLWPHGREPARIL